MRATRANGLLPPAYGSPEPAGGLVGRIKARKKPLIITLLILGGLAFAAGWNPPTNTVHSFTEASDYNARRESGCTNSGEGCHGDDARLSDFNAYHPETPCKTCHDYTGVGCIPCHGPSQHECTGCHDGTMEGASDCVRLSDSFPKGHYRESLHTAMGTDMSQVVLAAVGGEAKATCADCHSRDLKAAHTGVPLVEGSDYGPDVSCVECHNDEQSGALDAVLKDWKKQRCEDCHGEKARSPMHAADIATVIEATGEAGCGSTGEGCHNLTDLHALHPNAPATCSGSAAEGEPGCHDLELQSHEPTVTACATGEGACHPAYVKDDYSHKDDASVHVATAQGSAVWVDPASGVRLTCASCHSSDLGIEHGRSHVGFGADACQQCHNKNETTIRAVRESWPDRETADACTTCHADKHGSVNSVHTAVQLDDTGAVSQTACVKSGCHGSADVRVLHKDVGCTNPACHSNGRAISGSKMTCGGPDTRSGRNCHASGTHHVGMHVTLEAGIAGTKSSACTACHGTNLFAVAAGEHQGCSCHSYGQATPSNRECAACHKGSHAPHGFVNGLSRTGEGWIAASGHNTTTFGKIGAKTKFDGSQGVTLTWTAEKAFAPLLPTWEVEAGFQLATAPDGWAGRTVNVGDSGVVTTTWDFPTVNVFWQPGDPAAPADALFLGKDSVVTCQDCHAGLSAAGPHGADQNWGLDPDYPGDYSYAELTKRVDVFPSGIKLRKSLDYATQGGASPNVITGYNNGMTLICSKCHDLQNYQSGTTVNNPLPLYSTGSASFGHDAETYVPLNLGSKGVYVNGATRATTGFAVFTDAAGKMVSSTSPKITSFTPGTTTVVGTLTFTDDVQVWAQSATVGTVTVATIGSSNTAHSSHHQDTNDGSAQCVNCHIGIPHGWKRPRLLVNTGWGGGANSIGAGVVVGDAAPYRSPDALGTTRTNGGIPMNPNGYNGMGMLTLSAVDNHRLNASASTVRHPAETYYTGAAYWSEPSCQACNDHAGEDGIRIINEE